MVPVLFFHVFFLQQALHINFARLVKFVLLLLLDVLVYHVIDLFVSHVLLLYFICDFVENCLVSDRNSEKALLKLIEIQTCVVFRRDLLIFGQSSENRKNLLG
jgi:hypothetical protein